MAAVASNHVVEASRSHENDQLTEPTPSFTAVNGSASPAPPVKPNLEQEPPKAISEATAIRITLPNHTQVAQHSAAPPSHDTQSNGPDSAGQDSRPSPASMATQTQDPVSAHASKSPTPAPTHAQAFDRPSSTQPQQHPDGPSEPRRQSQHYPSGHSRNPSNQPVNMPAVSPQTTKRKRSFDGEQERRPEYESQGHPAYPVNGPPHSPGGPRRHELENGHARDMQGYSPRQTYPPPPGSYGPTPHDTYAGPPRMRDNTQEIYPRPERHQLIRNEYDQPVDPSIAPQAPRPYYTDPDDAHMANVLTRETRGYESMPRDTYGSPEDDDDPNGSYGDYGTNRSSQDLDRKRRKRVFSNRTKTGCMTCRRRKKKCDEQHPECKTIDTFSLQSPFLILRHGLIHTAGNNCLRGGFVCEGYSTRNTWQKPANAKAPIPLQSKNGYPPGTPGNRGPYPGPRYLEHTPEYAAPLPPHMDPRQSYDQGDSRKPIAVEDDRDQVYGRPSPPEAQQKPAYGKQQTRPYPSNPPHMSKYQGENGHRGSIYEMAPDSQEQSSMHPPASVHRSNSSASQYSGPPHPPNHNNTPPNHNSVQAIAQAAATHPASLRPSQRTRNDQYTEREKMLKGLYYYPLTPALTEDREKCIAAIWRFNNATNPSHGASPEERSRLFRQILALRPNPEPPLSSGEVPRPQMEMPFGSCGERVVVEAPFHCDYGYNITIGDDVLIGADCRISDTCTVTIGARCIFSPGVKLVCATYPIDPRRRMGSNGPALGRNIVIEEDCWIGSNVTILAGVRVGKSSTVGAGSLLHQVCLVHQVYYSYAQKLRESTGCSTVHGRCWQSGQSQSRYLRRECGRPMSATTGLSNSTPLRLHSQENFPALLANVSCAKGSKWSFLLLASLNTLVFESQAHWLYDCMLAWCFAGILSTSQ
jgi:acetyltransferase-like isoleucine patch superfamily enzyme